MDDSFVILFVFCEWRYNVLSVSSISLFLRFSCFVFNWDFVDASYSTSHYILSLLVSSYYFFVFSIYILKIFLRFSCFLLLFLFLLLCSLGSLWHGHSLNTFPIHKFTELHEWWSTYQMTRITTYLPMGIIKRLILIMTTWELSLISTVIYHWSRVTGRGTDRY